MRRYADFPQAFMKGCEHVTSMPTVGLKFRAYADGATARALKALPDAACALYNALRSALRAGAARSARGAPPSTIPNGVRWGDEPGSSEASAEEQLAVSFGPWRCGAMPKTTVDLSVELGNRKVAESILAALAPDNVNLPDGMELHMRVESTKLHVIISCDIERADTLAATVDEVLGHVRLALAAESSVGHIHNSVT
ncbi:MAG: KEOPS complex subunit Pcc1 [Conexivisphaerales archaeon]|nr:KEOPS complex subunit Pcc1 [Conexivisphaerales archaeon]